MAQSNTPDVIVSSGGEFANDYAQIMWTLGDFQITTYAKDDLILTQGFLQTELKVTGVVNIKETSKIELNVFPNPVRDILNIQVQSETTQAVFWELFNQKGQVVKSSTILNNKLTQVDFSPFENGVYYVRTYTKDGAFFKVFKLVYLN